MDRNFFIAILLCAGIYLGWYNYNAKHYPAAPAAVATTTVQTNSAVSQDQIKTSIEAEKKSNTAAPVRMVEVGSDNFGFVLNTQGGTLDKMKLKEIRGKNHSNLEDLIGGSGQLSLNVPAPEWAYLTTAVYQVASESKDAVVLKYQDENVVIERRYRLLPDLFTVDHTVSFIFKKPAPKYVFIGLKMFTEIAKVDNEKRGVYFSQVSGGMKHWSDTDFSELRENVAPGHWAGITSRYFVNALVDVGSIKPSFQGSSVTLNQRTINHVNLVYPIAGSQIEIPQKYYYGPKELETLKAVGHTLDLAVDFGWFTFIAFPMLWALKWLFGFFHNYGISIILLTVAVKILTYPLTHKSMTSMKKMQKIQPQLQALREKYKDDKEKLNREMMQMMKSHGYNPMSGCLPIFIQMPVFIALYNVLYGAIDLYGQPFFAWIVDLSAKDPYFVTPILLSIVMFVQQKMTPAAGMEPAQQKMMMFMPVIFGLMMMGLPAGLTLYMLVNSVVSILQQVLINKSMGESKQVSA